MNIVDEGDFLFLLTRTAINFSSRFLMTSSPPFLTISLSTCISKPSNFFSSFYLSKHPDRDKFIVSDLQIFPSLVQLPHCHDKIIIFFITIFSEYHHIFDSFLHLLCSRPSVPLVKKLNNFLQGLVCLLEQNWKYVISNILLYPLDVFVPLKILCKIMVLYIFRNILV